MMATTSLERDTHDGIDRWMDKQLYFFSSLSHTRARAHTHTYIHTYKALFNLCHYFRRHPPPRRAVSLFARIAIAAPP